MELLTGKSEKQLVHLKPADVYSPEAAAKVIETDEKVFRHNAVSYTHLTLPTTLHECRSRWSQYH